MLLLPCAMFFGQIQRAPIYTSLCTMLLFDHRACRLDQCCWEGTICVREKSAMVSFKSALGKHYSTWFHCNISSSCRKDKNETINDPDIRT